MPVVWDAKAEVGDARRNAASIFAVAVGPAQTVVLERTRCGRAEERRSGAVVAR